MCRCYWTAETKELRRIRRLHPNTQTLVSLANQTVFSSWFRRASPPPVFFLLLLLLLRPQRSPQLSQGCIRVIVYPPGRKQEVCLLLCRPKASRTRCTDALAAQHQMTLQARMTDCWLTDKVGRRSGAATDRTAVIHKHFGLFNSRNFEESLSYCGYSPMLKR